MAKRNGMFFTLGVFLLIAQQVSNAAPQRDEPLQKVDTAVINGFYEDAFLTVEENLRKSDDLINKAWKMSIDIGYDQGIADGYYYTGTMYMRKGAWNVAGRYFEKAVSLYAQGQFLDNLPDCHLRLGQIYLQDGRYYTGLQNFLSGLRVATDKGQDIERVKLNIELANYHNTISKDYGEAVAALNDAAELVEASGYTDALGSIYLQYGISYSGQRDYDKALHYVAAAQQEFDLKSSAESLLRVLLVEGDVYAANRDEQRLATVLDEAGALVDTVGNEGLSISYQLLYATELYLLEDYDGALEICERLYSSLDSVDMGLERHRIQALHVKIVYAMGDSQLADSLFNAYEYAKDSLYAAHFIGQGREMSENYKLDKFERQIKEQELLLSNTRYQRYGLIAGIAVLLTILVILYFHFREKDKLAHRVAIKNTEISVQNEVLKQANKQNELLLREIHHRVKNNLQIINSLLSLQSRKTANPDVISMMRESSSRIHSIALIHNKLYEQQSINRLDVQDYIEQLGAHLLSIYNDHQKEVQFEVTAHDVFLDIDTAIPVGLILTELITNSLKYAFEGRDGGHIHVDMQREGEREYELVFKDDGVGVPEDKRQKTNETLGFRLIHSLTSQLAGVVQYTFDECSIYRIRFKGQV
ncbi:histidine kinase dimerization/phosphoacceptor domain -containing protein [Parapedobacter sp. 10938]|uniref:histidine kinase dimerization/phosphoacceptor domain -containing protein n=1 Tax=Parapedobacter flavus TaxID=3110225 RepID=UPI002DB5E90C|nr:histidine kinase dimerization/phosphoacceptor domain -containing protein [Parapedobacter sp. 10938]MEC3881329.1 histidine kinase dimerization/phosphoacceptor domain -containing protein [Parapedobacter sp. 10938]